MRTPVKACLAAVAAWLIWLGLGRGFIAASAPTYDEPVHLASGYSALSGGRPLNWRDHPPLAELCDALPLLALRPAAMHQAAATLPLYPFADVFLYKNSVDARRMLDAARLWSLAVWGALLLGVIVAWAYALGGWRAAAGAAVLAAFCPPLLSNAALVTTDAAAAALYALLFYLLSRRSRPAWLWAAAGAALGAALAAKFSMIAAPLFVAAGLLTEQGLRGAPRARPAHVALLAAAAALTLAAVYARWGLDLYWQGLTLTTSRLGDGRASFFAGAYSLSGTWLYFPAAVLLKTPTPLLLLALGAGAAWLRFPDRDKFWAAFPAAAFLLASLFSRTQIGYRHVLPIYPFLVVMGGWALSRLWLRPWGPWAAGGLVALQAAFVLAVQPHQLAFFSLLAGGPGRGYAWLVDSNLDWGQDLPALAEELRKRGDPPVYLSYFGVGDPSYYGIRYLPLAWYSGTQRREGVAEPAAPLLAVSATNLQGVYYADHDVWAWLKTRRPAFVAGHSIFLYDLSHDADGRERLAAVAAASGFGQAARRLIEYGHAPVPTASR